MTRKSWQTLAYSLVVIAFLIGSLQGLDISWKRICDGLPKIAALLELMFLHFDRTYIPDVIKGLRESFQIAALGTFFAAFLALPFGALAARNLTRLPALPFVGKTALNVIRTFPDLILAIAFIKALGPGPLAGVLALSFHSIGMMGKLYAERIESVDKGPLEALRAAGASPLEVFRHGIVPEVLPDFLSFTLYRFELNIRSASVLGIVGAGGVGTLLEIQRNSGDWAAIGTILIGIIVTVGTIDFVSAKLRARLT